MENKKPENFVEVDGIKVDVSELSDKAQYFNMQVIDLQNKIAKAQFELAQLEAAKQMMENTFVDAYKEERKVEPIIA